MAIEQSRVGVMDVCTRGLFEDVMNDYETISSCSDAPAPALNWGETVG